jgi:hypothetical protein
MSKSQPNTIITMVPDRCYERLVEETKAAPNKTMYERFEGDKGKTKIWLEKDGRLMSHMPPEVYRKEIQPISRVQQKQKEAIANGTGALEFGNGRGHMLQTLLDKGVDNDTAVRVAQAFYRVVPLDVRMPEEMIETIAKGWTGEGFGFPDTFVREICQHVARCKEAAGS